MGEPRRWSKEAERQWRGTFTRGNIEGAKKLHYMLRTQGAEAVAKAEKQRSLKRMEEGVRSSVQGAFDQVTDRMLSADRILVGPEGEGYTKAGVKERISYSNAGKVIEKFDGCGNLVSVETISY